MEQDIPKITEDRLVSGLQPIRGFVLAQALYHFMEIGIHEALSVANDLTVSDIARNLSLHEERLRGFLHYLANEGFVRLSDGDKVNLTAIGKESADFYPWYKLLIGGYAQTFQQLSSALQTNGPYADRNSSNVGIGSCGISQYDALPMTRRLLERVSGRWRTVVDLGCGDGSYLVDLCRSIPDICGIGLDPEKISVEAALRAASYYGIADRVDVQVGSATALPDLSNKIGPLCFITAFVLQEVLEQSGRAAVLEILNSAFNRYPDSYWIVIEVDHRPNDSTVMTKGLGLAYYNPYYLIHQLTEQKLEQVEFWEQLYREAGLHIVAIEHPDPSYDSLGLKVGFLLTRGDWNPERGDLPDSVQDSTM